MSVYLQMLFKKKEQASPSGNRTPVSRVTGGDTYHYTNEDWLMGDLAFLRIQANSPVSKIPLCSGKGDPSLPSESTLSP